MSIYLFIRKYIVLFSVRGNQPRLDFKTDCSTMNWIQLGDEKVKIIERALDNDVF